MSIKRKLHHLISGQLPDFVRTEYPQFVTFLEYYYKFLETQGQAHDVFLNSTDWNDIDLTLDLFVPQFRNQFSYDIPSSAILENRRLIKYINQYYESKGSETSTEIFFRIMFNDTARVSYPGDYVLRASDGRWQRKRYIKVETTLFEDENIFELAGQEITLRYLEFIRGAGDIERTITTRCFDVYETARPNIYQLEVDINPNYVFPDVISVDLSIAPSLGNEDTHVYVQNGNTTYGTITKQLISINRIVNEGSNFRRDDAYFISQTGIEGPYFGGDYSENLGTSAGYAFETVQNNAVVRVSETAVSLVEPYFAEDYDLTGDYAAAPIRGKLRQMQIVDTGERFFARNNAGENVNTFSITFTPPRPSSSSATVIFNTGLIYHAPGEFKDNSGFLSDIVKLQDNDYYQPYSYVIETTVPIGSWKDTYLKSTHPAGFKMFAELLLSDSINQTVTIDELFNQNDYYMDLDDETITVSEEKSISFATFKDDSISVSEENVIEFQSFYSEIVNTSEEIDNKNFNKSIFENLTVTEELNKVFQISLTENVNLFDNTSLENFLSSSDSITLSDTVNYVFDQKDDPTSDLQDNILISETHIKEIDKSLFDEILISENVERQLQIKFEDAINIMDSPSIESFRNFSETFSISDILQYNLEQKDDATSDLQENINITDSLNISFSKDIIDSIDVRDKECDVCEGTNFNYNKNEFDFITINENLTYTFDQKDDATSDLQDNINVTDSLSISFITEAFDNIDLIEETNYSYNKNEFDFITINENLTYTFDQKDDATSDLQDNITISENVVISTFWSREYADSISIADLAVPLLTIPITLVDNISSDEISVINSNKSISDPILIEDVGGSLFTENYAEDYFGEYYVGTFNTF